MYGVELRYHVRLVGYPRDLPLDAPSRFSRRAALLELRHGWRTGRIHFRRLTDLELQHGARRECMPVWMLALEPLRVDTGKRPLRDPRTRARAKIARRRKSRRLISFIEDRKLSRE